MRNCIVGATIDDMVITYTVSTQFIGDARAVAMRRATAEGWGRATVMNVVRLDLNTYEVTLVVSK